MMRSEGYISACRDPLHRSRTAEYLARDFLRNRGYLVIRSIDPDHTQINLVAWKPDGGPHLIRVTTTRKALSGASEVASVWNEEIDRLRSLTIPTGGSVHLWIYTDRKAWHRYQALPGGIAETEL